MSVDWEEKYNRFVSASKEQNKEEMSKIQEEVQEFFLNPSQEDVEWIKSYLSDDNRKWFVGTNIRGLSAFSEELFIPLMSAAIEEINPDFNRTFVEPCMKAFGARRVNEYLLHILERGPPFEQAGAVNALYWAQIPLNYEMKNIDIEAEPDSQFTLKNATEESRKAYLELADIWQKKHLLYLEHFVKSKHTEVQQSLIPSLDLNEEHYPESHKFLVAKAIKIAKSHPDEYIRHRLGVQLGTEKYLKPLPYRRKDHGKKKKSLKERIERISKKFKE